MNRTLLSTLAIGLAAASLCAGEGKYEANWASLDARPMPEWFEDARVGIFVVWGPYCVPGWAPKGQYAEWYGNKMRRRGSATQQYHEKHYGKDSTYEKFGPMMKAEKWDPDAWADLFVQMGAKYVVFTANYHDGYCLWPSPYAKAVGEKKWHAGDIGPKRDVLGDMFAAGRKRGLRMGIYYSLYEWYDPLWLKDRAKFVTDHFHPQFKDVIAKYKPEVVFADGEWAMDYKAWRSEELLAWVFNESPVRDTIVLNDRWGKVRGKHGSFYESEYGGGNMSPKHPWQEDRGIGRSYGYNRNEKPEDYDSRAKILQMLTRCAGNGGNYLPCVGPKADGTIDATQRQRLLELGAWLKVNGEAIYGAKASPFWPRKFPWGTVTHKPATAKGKPDTLFLHVYGKPKGKIELPALTNKVLGAHLLADKARKPLAVTAGEGGPSIALPAVLPDEAVSVVAIQIEGTPVIDAAVREGADGRVVLRAQVAETHGGTPQYENAGKKDNIGHWNNPKDHVSWTFTVAKPGAFDVRVTYSCAKGAGGSQFVVAAGDQSVVGTSKETGAWDAFKSEVLG
ncbi:alpha-L-fucosidase [bacterium]|nr:alpha-L-fucosidase [bacterium]